MAEYGFVINHKPTPEPQPQEVQSPDRETPETLHQFSLEAFCKTNPQIESIRQSLRALKNAKTIVMIGVEVGWDCSQIQLALDSAKKLEKLIDSVLQDLNCPFEVSQVLEHLAGQVADEQV